MFPQEVLNNFYEALSVTGKGMGGIFIFMAVFYLVIIILDKLFPQKHNGK